MALIGIDNSCLGDYTAAIEKLTHLVNREKSEPVKEVKINSDLEICIETSEDSQSLETQEIDGQKLGIQKLCFDIASSIYTFKTSFKNIELNIDGDRLGTLFFKSVNIEICKIVTNSNVHISPLTDSHFLNSYKNIFIQTTKTINFWTPNTDETESNDNSNITFKCKDLIVNHLQRKLNVNIDITNLCISDAANKYLATTLQKQHINLLDVLQPIDVDDMYLFFSTDRYKCISRYATNYFVLYPRR